jgi:bacterial leucyl aminopeptidase
MVSPSGDRIERLAVFPDVPPLLDELRDHRVRLGIISDRGPIPAEDVNEALAAADLWDFFVPDLVIYGRKDSPRIFELAALQAGTPTTGRLMLCVGEDAAERAQALRAGFLVAPHPRLALSVLEEHSRET